MIVYLHCLLETDKSPAALSWRFWEHDIACTLACTHSWHLRRNGHGATFSPSSMTSHFVLLWSIYLHFLLLLVLLSSALDLRHRYNRSLFACFSPVRALVVVNKYSHFPATTLGYSSHVDIILCQQVHQPTFWYNKLHSGSTFRKNFPPSIYSSTSAQRTSLCVRSHHLFQHRNQILTNGRQN